MKTLLFSMIFIFTGAMAVQAQELNVKTDDAKIQFKIPAEKVSGTMSGFSATIKFDPSNPGSSSMSGTVRVATINTGTDKRDEHLKSADYFNASKYPTISFTSSKIEKSGDSYKMTGILKIKDKEKEVTFTVKVEDGKIVGYATVHAIDFDLMTKKKREDSKTEIRITVPTA